MSHPPLAGSFDAVLLDAGGVLVLPEHDTMRAVLAPFGVEPSDEELTRAHYAGIAARDLAPGRPWDAYDRAYVQACGVGDQVAGAMAALSTVNPEWVSATPGARGYLAALAGLGVPVAVVSNSVGKVERQLGVAGVCQVGPGTGVPVAAVIDSHVVGVSKPDPGIFRLGLAAVGAAPERTLMVGDYAYADVLGAEQVGLRAVHLDPYAHCGTAHRSPHISGLGEVVDLVRAGRT